MSSIDRSRYILPKDTPFCALECQKAFDGLSEKERLYAYNMSQACSYGSLIVLYQTSQEAPLIYLLLHKMFKHQSLDDLKKLALEKAGMNEDDFKAFLMYCAGFYSNMGNYNGFGDWKFVPDFDQAKFETMIRSCAAFEAEKETFETILTEAFPKIYSLNERELRLGFGNQGVTTYHSSNVDQTDTERIDRFMKAKKMEAWNTRLFKSVEVGTDKVMYEIRLASYFEGNVSGPEEFEGTQVRVTRGDYGPLLRRVNKFLEAAKEHAANENQVKMLEKYVEHFNSGSLDAHKDGSRFWIKDMSPAVESYIGFIENYRDPAGARSEFEGFVAAVNLETSGKFAKLVDSAEKFLALLPWDKAYEKDKFIRPDFTSLDILCFGASGIPSGINIPNYDEIRQKEGFKNVSLRNVIAAKPQTKNFLSQEDEDLVQKYDVEAFEVQVGLHELLGHGSGKLFIRGKDGSYNFDMEAVKDLETGQKITSWYEEGEIYSSKFAGLSNAYEECRAEAVGYYLCTFPDVLKTFGIEDETKANDIKYVNLLSKLQAGLTGLEHYSQEKNTWGQAHCHARFVLLMVAIEAGDGFVQVKEQQNAKDEKPDLLLTMDRSKIESVGKPAFAKLLQKLQLYRCTGDVPKARALFEQYSKITPDILRWKEIVVARRKPRRILVIPNMAVEENVVSLVSYPETPEGCVQSNIERFADDDIEAEILELWKKDEENFD